METIGKKHNSALVTLIIGLALNIALGGSKLAVGLLADSAAVISDAFNNLSDFAVSFITVIAVALSARKADHDHPYGHGRYEYIATFVLGAVIVAVGLETMINGIERIAEPVDVDYDIAVFAVLGASVGVKAFMAVFYSVMERRAKSEAIKAAAVDSASDAGVTSAVLICAIVESKTSVHIDGIASVAVSVVILIFAVRILKGVINRLLGARPDPELTEKIGGIISENERVISFHDLIINDYGTNQKIAEADVVLPADMSFSEVHAVCDELERRVHAVTGVRLSIHADPASEDDRLVELSGEICSALKNFCATAHDLSVNDETMTVEMDIVLPDDKAPINEIRGMVEAKVREKLGYNTKIEFDFT